MRQATDRSSPVLQRFPKLVAPKYKKFARMDEDFDCRNEGSSARARLLVWRATGEDSGTWDESEGTLRVYAPPKNNRGVILKDMTVGLDWCEGPGWIVVSGGKARKITVTADVAVSGGNFLGHVVDWDDPDEDPDPDNAGLTVHNPHQFEGPAGSLWEAGYWPAYDYYSAIQGYCADE
jgi:hypothetical protein